MILRVASLLSVVVFLQLLVYSVKVAHVFKYYADYVTTTISESIYEGQDEYDFIVVGAGSAGSVVANRLSKYNKVLLLEAGGTPFYANSLPILAINMIHQPETDYMYKTVPQQHASQGTPGKVSYWPRGKMLGGSSNLNYMMYIRGHPLDYDNWAKLTGDDGWSYKNLLPYFKRPIDYNGGFASDDKSYGFDYGTHSIEACPRIELHEYIMNAAAELKYDSRIDLNGPQREGFGYSDLAQRKGKRETSYSAFLEPILYRENLVISKYSQAIKLHLNKKNKAVGIWYAQHSKFKYAKAAKEIIVCAGSVDSPKLLMLSGIGPKEHLKEVGIEAKIDLPVGKNLKDHIITFLAPFMIDKPLGFRPDRDLGIKDIFDYYLHGKGAFTYNLGIPAVAFFTSSSEKNRVKANWTDFQLLLLNSSPYEGIAKDISDGMKLEKSILDTLYNDDVIKSGKDSFSITLTLGRPKSTGYIKLASKNPFDAPIIDPKYLEHPNDITRYVEAVKFAFKLVEETKSFQDLNATYVNVPLDGCKNHKFRSTKYWECYLRTFSLTMYHPSSTCKMGSGLNDKNSVVDSKLRVLHTKGLRVADVSIMPDLINGNTNTPAVMIGEKASAMIREYWAEQYAVCPKWERLRNYKQKGNLKCYYSRLV